MLGGSADLTGFAAGQIVQEFAWDDDVDEACASGSRTVVGSPRRRTRLRRRRRRCARVVPVRRRRPRRHLVDALTNLVDRGFLVLCTPRADQDGARRAQRDRGRRRHRRAAPGRGRQRVADVDGRCGSSLPSSAASLSGPSPPGTYQSRPGLTCALLPHWPGGWQDLATRHTREGRRAARRAAGD
jgi:hypothetical protein